VGLMQELEIQVAQSRRSYRTVAVVTSSRPGAWAMSKSIHRLDGIFFRRSNGFRTLSGMLAGLPTIMISTTGAKSGLTRTSPLTAVPVAASIGLVGTNFGQARTPGWVYNLEANPVGTASRGDIAAAFVARYADDGEREEILTSAARIYSGYDKYRERVTVRNVRVFILDSPSDTGGSSRGGRSDWVDGGS
jgi:deazaflavin-dependent oxidoreductase (nitroreductase family)